MVWFGKGRSGRGVCLGIVLAGLVAPCGGAAEPVPGEFLVKFQTRGALRPMGGARLPAGASVTRSLGVQGWQVVRLADAPPTEEGLRRLKTHPGIAQVEPNARYHLLEAPSAPAVFLPNDPEFPRLTGLERIGIEDAWAASTGSTNVVVAVFDTGMDLSHPDLAPNLWQNRAEIPGNGIDDDGNGWRDDSSGYDVVEGDGDPSDTLGHGTHVAGIIGAVGNNGLGVSGVCWRVSLLPVRIGTPDGFATTAQLVEAFAYVRSLRADGENVRVINCSWGGEFPSVAMREAIEEVGNAGILVVCAAGNDGQDNDLMPIFPAGYDVPQVISVAASTDCDGLASFSNFGARTVDLAAPGTAILSTFRGGTRYATLSGTSMAAPHVSGVAALVLSVNPEVRVELLKQILLHTTDPIPGWEGKLTTGGRLNAARAVAAARTGAFPDVHSFLPSNLEAISRSGPAGALGNDGSGAPSIDAEGRFVVFQSTASNLVPGDDGQFDDVFLYDRSLESVVRLSQNASGTGGNGDSWGPVISRDGRSVAFMSAAGNLVAGDTDAGTDIYLYDRVLQTLELVSVRADGKGPGHGDSLNPCLSPDGSLVLFDSEAPDLVAGDSNHARDVFLRDRTRGVTERVSLSTTGAQANDDSQRPVMSDDGMLVAFESSASNLVARDRNAAKDIFVRNRKSGSTERVNMTDNGATEFRFSSWWPAMSGDGRYVTFETRQDPGAAGATDPDDWNSVVLVDRKTKAIRWIDRPPGVTDSHGHGAVESLSADGRFVLFSSADDRWGPGGIPGDSRLYELDQWLGITAPVVLNRLGYAPEYDTVEGRASADGRWLVFASGASNLVPDDGNAAWDVFLEDRGELRADLAVRRVGDAAGDWVGGQVRHPQAPQRAVAGLGPDEIATFEVRVSNAGASGAFLIRLTGPIAGGPLAWKAKHVRSGADVSAALAGPGWPTGVLGGGSNDVLRIELHQPRTGTTPPRDSLRLTVSSAGDSRELDAVVLAVDAPPMAPSVAPISTGLAGGPASRHARSAMASRDGMRVVFLSEADDLVPQPDSNFAADIFLWDRSTGGVLRLSDPSSTTQANGASGRPALSDDGRWVAFPSRASNLVPGDTNGVQDIFLRDVNSGQITRVNVPAAGGQADAISDSVGLAGAAQVVVFASHASNLVPGDGNRSRDIFVRSLDGGGLECVSRSERGEFGDADSEHPSISRDGRYVLFQSLASNLAPLDGNGTSDIYLWDRVGRRMELISATPSRAAGNGPSVLASMSDDARWVTFHSYATDLGPIARASAGAAYLFDRTNKVLQRVDTLVRGLPPGAVVDRAVVSRDGLKIALAVSPACAPGGTVAQVYVCDLDGSGLSLVSRTHAGVVGNAETLIGRWSGSSRYLTLETSALNLVGEPTRGAAQILLADLMSAGVDALVQREPGSPWRGQGLLTGGDRSLLLPVPQVQAVPVGLAVRNSGTGPDRFRIRAVTTDPARLSVTAVPAGVPGASPVGLVGGAGWLSPSLDPGAELRLEIRFQFVSVGSSLDRVQVLLQVTSDADRTQVDEIWLLAVPDQNRNRLPDSWEAAHPLVQATGTSDLDRDGWTDYQEWLVGSDPANPFEGSQRLTLSRTPSGGMEIGWRGQQYRWYWVERSAYPGGKFVPRHAMPLVGTDGPMAWQEPAEWPEEGGAYRVRVELP